jgi:hypothetical protein
LERNGVAFGIGKQVTGSTIGKANAFGYNGKVK